jgi:hypothetical protein
VRRRHGRDGDRDRDRQGAAREFSDFDVDGEVGSGVLGRAEHVLSSPPKHVLRHSFRILRGQFVELAAENEKLAGQLRQQNKAARLAEKYMHQQRLAYAQDMSNQRLLAAQDAALDQLHGP